jgi:hypothetical protein
VLTAVQNVLPPIIMPLASPEAGPPEWEPSSVGLGLGGGKLVFVGVSVRFCTVIQLAEIPFVRFASAANWLTLKNTLLSAKSLYAEGKLKLRGCAIKMNV